MTETNPLVSVVLPVYNGAKYLAEALDSVFAQTYRPLDVIVIDDGSTDNSAEIAQAYPNVRYFYQSNQGVSIARNVGIAVAQGELIALLDQDDSWKPEKLRFQIDYMMTHPEVEITATHTLHFLEPEISMPNWFQPERHLGEQPAIMPSTLVIRKSVFSQIGLFSPNYGSSDDTEWLCRARDGQVSIVMLPEVLMLRRLHGGNVSWETASTFAARGLKILRESIARKSQNARSGESLSP